MKLTIHIGMPKTGTTALQDFFLANRSVLADQGILYPDAGLAGSSHYMLVPQHPRRRMETLRDYWGLLGQEAGKSGLGHVLISSEFFCVDPPELLRELAAPHFQDVRIVVYVRRHDTLAYSSFSQVVRKRRFIRDIREIAGLVHDYHKIAMAFASVFGVNNVTLRPYEKCQMRQGIFAHFLSVLGLSLDGRYALPRGADRVNASLHPDVLEFLRHCNMLPMIRPEMEALDAALCEISATLFRKAPVPALLSPAERHGLVASMAEKDAELARTFLGRKGGELFLEPVPDPAAPYEPYPGLSQEKQHLILDALPAQVRSSIENLRPQARTRDPQQICLPRLPKDTLEGLKMERIRRDRELDRLYELLDKAPQSWAGIPGAEGEAAA